MGPVDRGTEGALKSLRLDHGLDRRRVEHHTALVDVAQLRQLDGHIAQ